MTKKILGIVVAVAACAHTCAAEDGWPEFSWDTVPVYIHFGQNSAPLSEHDLQTVARLSNFVCLEKGHGWDHFGSTEKGIAHDTRRLKALNPGIKVLFYWNTFLNYPLYDVSKELKAHPEWSFRDAQGRPIYKRGKLEQYNLMSPAFRDWWASVAGNAVSGHGCDGIFMDAVNQAKRAPWMEKGWGRGNEHLLTRAVIDMMQRADKAMGGNAILLYNGIRSSDRDGNTTGEEYLPYADGVTVEHFTAFQSQTRESIARDIAGIGRAGKAGKLVVVKGWPDARFNWTNWDKMQSPPEMLAAEAKEKITFSLACYMVAAQENCYFCYSWGYREQHGSLIDYPEFHRPLGRPTGDAKRNGWIYTRAFAHASAWVDLSNRIARIDWK